MYRRRIHYDRPADRPKPIHLGAVSILSDTVNIELDNIRKSARRLRTWRKTPNSFRDLRSMFLSGCRRSNTSRSTTRFRTTGNINFRGVEFALRPSRNIWDIWPDSRWLARWRCRLSPPSEYYCLLMIRVRQKIIWLWKYRKATRLHKLGAGRNLITEIVPV